MGLALRKRELATVMIPGSGAKRADCYLLEKCSEDMYINTVYTFQSQRQYFTCSVCYLVGGTDWASL